MAGKGNKANLRPPWKPGQSGNPSGINRKPISDRYQAVLELPLPDDVRRALKLDKGATYGDALAFRIILSAIKGRPDAAREVADRVEGKPRQRVEVTGADGKPIQTRTGAPARPMKGVDPKTLQALIDMAKKAGEAPSGSPPPA